MVIEFDELGNWGGKKDDSHAQNVPDRIFNLSPIVRKLLFGIRTNDHEF